MKVSRKINCYGCNRLLDGSMRQGKIIGQLVIMGDLIDVEFSLCQMCLIGIVDIKSVNKVTEISGRVNQEV